MVRIKQIERQEATVSKTGKVINSAIRAATGRAVVSRKPGTPARHPSANAGSGEARRGGTAKRSMSDWIRFKAGWR